MAPLRDAGIELVLPNADDRAMKDGCQAVVLACTELPLAIHKNMTALPIVDLLVFQCNSAVDFALS